MATVAVCLSGCGVMDGTEIHEAAHVLLALDQAGAQALICAPDMEQSRVVDHATGQPIRGERRNVLIESARIARGKIVDVARMPADRVDALIFPGGFGAALNLCSFARDGVHCTVHPAVEKLILAMADAGKPIGAACIAPVLVARVLGRRGPVALTIGNDPETARAIEAMGCRHCERTPGGHEVDEKFRVVSTPAFMYGDSGLTMVFRGIQGMVEAVLRMAKQ